MVPAQKVFQLGEEKPLGKDWQAVWQHLDMRRYAQVAPFKLQPVVILLDPASAAGGFTRAWTRLDAGIAVHQGYAFQWFSLAVALGAIYLLLGFRRASAGPGSGDER